MWQTYEPYRFRKTPPSIRISVTNSGKRLLINQSLASELGFTTRTKFIKLHFDPQRTSIGVTFHWKKTSHMLALCKFLLGRTVTYSINVVGFLQDIGYSSLKNGTYKLLYKKEGDYLVVDLTTLPKDDACG